MGHLKRLRESVGDLKVDCGLPTSDILQFTIPDAHAQLRLLVGERRGEISDNKYNTNLVFHNQKQFNSKLFILKIHFLVSTLFKRIY